MTAQRDPIYSTVNRFVRKPGDAKSSEQEKNKAKYLKQLKRKLEKRSAHVFYESCKAHKLKKTHEKYLFFNTFSLKQINICNIS